jgi:hypothetical protein
MERRRIVNRSQKRVRSPKNSDGRIRRKGASSMKNVHWLVMIGALGAEACHGRSGGVHTSQEVDVSQAPSAGPTNQTPFQIQGGTMTITPDADYSASGLLGASTTGSFGGFSLAWGPDASDLASRGLGSVLILNAGDDVNIVNAIKRLEQGQRVRVSGWRSSVEARGKTVGPVMKGSHGEDMVWVFPTELQINDTLYTPSWLPVEAK